MFKINDNFLKLPGSYLFSVIGKKVADYKSKNPDKTVISLGIGDVTLPLAKAVTDAMHRAVDEMGSAETFHGYSPDLGYEFLRKAIIENDYNSRNINLDIDEVFISDGAKSDCGNIVDIFAADNIIAVTDPVYPVYIDSNAMAGKTGEYDKEKQAWTDVVYMPCTAANGFVPEFPKRTPDIIYICCPNNPTGTTLKKSELQAWVDYANEHRAIIIYDAAYEAYISEPDVPHSIYECDGAKTCAIEMRSFSKNAGFTGTRLGFTVIPKEIVADGASLSHAQAHGGAAGSGQSAGGVTLNSLWARRHGTKFNGAPYIIQRAGEAVYSDEGKAQTREQIAYYMKNASVIREGLLSAGYEVYGGINAPYIWLKTPDDMPSWDFFDLLLERAGVVGTPGSGFGPSGEGYFRLTAFGTAENTAEAVRRIRSI